MENGVNTDYFIARDDVQKIKKDGILWNYFKGKRNIETKKTGEILEKMGIDFEMHFIGRGRIQQTKTPGEETQIFCSWFRRRRA